MTTSRNRQPGQRNLEQELERLREQIKELTKQLTQQNRANNQNTQAGNNSGQSGGNPFAGAGQRAGGLLRGAIGMAGGPIGVGMMAVMAALPMFMQRGADSGAQLNRQLGFFGEQALRTSRDVQAAASALRDLRAQTGASIGQVLSMGVVGGFAGASSMAGASAGLREQMAMFRPNTDAMLGAHMLGVNPMSVGTMDAASLQRTLTQAVAAGLARGMNEDAARGWLKTIVGEDNTRDIMRIALMSPELQQFVARSQQRASGLESGPAFARFQSFLERRELLTEQRGRMRDAWRMERGSMISSSLGQGTRFQQFRNNMGLQWMDAQRTFWVSLQPVLEAFRDTLYDILGVDPAGGVEAFGKALRAGAYEVGTAVKNLAGVLFIAGGAVGIFIEAIVRIVKIAGGLLKLMGGDSAGLDVMHQAASNEFTSARMMQRGIGLLGSGGVEQRANAMSTDDSWARQMHVPMGPQRIEGTLRISADGGHLTAQEEKAARSGRRSSYDIRRGRGSSP